MQIETKVMRSGLVKEYFKGLHHLPEYFEEKGFIKLLNKVVCPKTGVIKADVLYKGRIYKKTFFPSNWSSERVVKEILETIKSFNGEAILAENGFYEVVATMPSGIELQMIINQYSEVITAYPTLKNFIGLL